MSSTPTPQPLGHRPKHGTRRLHIRQRINQLTYASFGPGNGGILLNVSEGGLSFQGIGVVRQKQLIDLSFRLPGTDSPIEARGEVVWANESGKGGGLRFVDLSERARQPIKQWLANDVSSSSNFAAPVPLPPGPAGNLTGPEEELIEALPALTDQARTDAPAVEAELKAHKAGETSSSGPERVTASGSAVTRGTGSSSEARPARRTSFILAEYPEPQPQRVTSPRSIVFATGVLAGCIGVLAAIAGMYILAGAAHPTIYGSSQSPGDPRLTDAGGQNSPADGVGLTDGQTTSSSPSEEPPKAAGQGFANRPAAEQAAAIGTPPRRERNFNAFQDSEQKKTLSDQPGMALLNSPMPAPRSGAELREPPSSDAPPTIVAAEGPRSAAPNMPDLPKPPQPPTVKADRTATFMDAVLIQHNPPVYPPGAIKRHIQGLVTVSATIGIDGVPRGLQVVSGDSTLGRAAEAAISHWRYVPAVSGGLPVESQVTITINFQPKP